MKDHALFPARSDKVFKNMLTTRSASSLESTEVTEEENTITRTIIGAAIEVHRALRPGLLESAYETCLIYEFGLLINFNVTYLKEGIRRMKS